MRVSWWLIDASWMVNCCLMMVDWWLFSCQRPRLHFREVVIWCLWSTRKFIRGHPRTKGVSIEMFGKYYKHTTSPTWMTAINSRNCSMHWPDRATWIASCFLAVDDVINSMTDIELDLIGRQRGSSQLLRYIPGHAPSGHDIAGQPIVRTRYCGVRWQPISFFHEVKGMPLTKRTRMPFKQGVAHRFAAGCVPAFFLGECATVLLQTFQN